MEDESLRAAFTNAANVFTNFYRHSQHAQKRSCLNATRFVCEETAGWATSNSRNGVVGVGQLLTCLTRTVDELPQHEDFPVETQCAMADQPQLQHQEQRLHHSTADGGCWQDDDASLRAAFTHSANVFTQFYKHSQQLQKRAHARKKRLVSEEIAVWATSNSRGGVVGLDQLLSELKRKVDELPRQSEEATELAGTEPNCCMAEHEQHALRESRQPHAAAPAEPCADPHLGGLSHGGHGAPSYEHLPAAECRKRTYDHAYDSMDCVSAPPMLEQSAPCLNLHLNGMAMMSISPCKIRRVQSSVDCHNQVP